ARRKRGPSEGGLKMTQRSRMSFRPCERRASPALELMPPKEATRRRCFHTPERSQFACPGPMTIEIDRAKVEPFGHLTGAMWRRRRADPASAYLLSNSDQRRGS